MGKKLFLSASCVLSCGILLGFPEYSKAEELSKQTTVTKEEAQDKVKSYIKGVSEKSYPNWKGAQVGQSTILYDLEGSITGYAFQVQKNNQDKGYIIASSEKQAPSIIESTREGKYPYQQVEEGKSIYTGPLQHYKKVDQTIVNLHTEQTIDIKTAKQQIETTKPKNSTERTYSPKKELAQEQPTFKENSIPNVPDNQWYYGCTPTAVSNIAEYWAQNGYNNLKQNNETTNQVIEKLGKIMKTVPGVKLPGRAEGGTTFIRDIVPGVKQYWGERGYQPEVNLDTTPTYEEYTKEIDAGRPIIVSLVNDPMYSNHSVTGVGYEQMYIPEINEDFKNFILHDTWEDTPVDAYYSYNDSQKYINSYTTITPFSFVDVPRNHWAYNEIAYMAQNKIMTGYGNGYFGSADNVTREQLAALLYRYLKPETTNENPFKDINDTSFKKEILALTKSGIFSVNSEKTFNPKGTATRAEIATVLTKAFHLKVKANYEFNDMKGHWANEYVKALYSNGIATGTGNKNFSPDAKVTREQMAMFLYRAIHMDENYKPSPI
ncbi:S-layer homology domain-containing protein [Bacillus toyonensis]|uniref:S-layer homology domain-containing protein n=2 Tax=Bacillus toyonensis TaxID=155322 RepID=UPI0035E39E14